jgi:hypothetical protein
VCFAPGEGSPEELLFRTMCIVYIYVMLFGSRCAKFFRIRVYVNIDHVPARLAVEIGGWMSFIISYERLDTVGEELERN